MYIKPHISLKPAGEKFCLRLAIALGFICSWVGCVCSARAQNVVVEAHLDTAGILIGEQVRIRLDCTAPKNTHLVLPHYAEGATLIPGVEVVATGRTDTTWLNDGRQMRLRRYYTITSFDSALYSIPPFKVEAGGRCYQSRGNIGLKVNTVPVDTVHVDKFAGPHAAVEMPFRWTATVWVLVWVALCLLVGFLALVVRLSDSRLITRRIVVQPPTPAHVTALRHIKQIQDTPHADAKSYYMQLTTALRTYIEGRFGFNAREMTTSEIIEKFQASDDATALRELQEVLLTADLVKFAKHQTSFSDQDRSLVQALDFVQHTKVEPQAPARPRVEYVDLTAKKSRKAKILLGVAAGLLLGGTIAAAVSATVWLYQSFL